MYFPLLFGLFVSTLANRLAGKTSLVISFVSKVSPKKTRLKSHLLYWFQFVFSQHITF